MTKFKAHKESNEYADDIPKDLWRKALYLDGYDLYHATVKGQVLVASTDQSPCLLVPAPSQDDWEMITRNQVIQTAVEVGHHSYCEIEHMAHMQELQNMDEWNCYVQKTHSEVLTQEGFYNAIRSTRGFSLYRDNSMLQSLISRYRSRSLTLHFATFEEAPSLKDVQVLLDLDPMGEVNPLAPLEEKEEIDLFEQMCAQMEMMKKVDTRWKKGKGVAGYHEGYQVLSKSSKNTWARWIMFFFRDHPTNDQAYAFIQKYNTALPVL